MRKFSIALLLLFVATLVACNNSNSESSSSKVDLKLALEAEPTSRVSFAAGRYGWSGNEQLGLFVGSAQPTFNAKSSVSVADGRAYCSTSVYPFAAGDVLYGYMPYKTSNSGVEAVSLEIPANQTLAAAGDLGSVMPMVATPYTLGEGEQSAPITMRPLGGVVCFNIYASTNYAGEKVKSITYAANKPLAGAFEVNLLSESLAISGYAVTSVTTSLTQPYQVGSTLNAVTPISMVVAPGAYEGTLTVVTDAATYTYDYSRTVARNTYYDANIDLSQAENREALSGGGDEPEATPVTATLTYEECKSILVKSYGSPKSYTNSYGTWTICVYDNSNGMQINSGKVAYIGTPTFGGDIKKITLNFAESYSGDILLCSQSGTTSVAGQFESYKCSGKAYEYTLTSTGHKSLFIRSSACARITKITIVAGGGSGNGGGTTPDPTPDPDPDPTPNPGDNPSTYAYDWAELPVVNYTKEGNYLHSNNKTLYYAHHLCAGGEKNAQRNGSARNYTVCYSAEHHCPLWVAAPRHKSYESGASRTDAYGKDPNIPSDIQYNSKNTGGGCNKGHMLGSAERLSSTATNKQVFYYTNIAPQYSGSFNTGGGAWNNLEDHVDGLVCSDTLYVVIGCYFKDFSKNGASATPSKISYGGRTDVTRPTMFYYALLRTKKGSSGKRVQDCSASELQCAAFTICHKMEKGHEPQAADMMSIEELEKLTGVTYFPNVPNAPKSTYKASEWGVN